MTEKELIHQVLNETNIDLYNFFAKKLLIEYPEYRKKIKKYWIKHLERFIIINNVIINDSKDITNGYDINDDKVFYYTLYADLEEEGYLNYILRQEGYD